MNAIRKVLVVSVLLAAASGCVSTHMRGFMERDIRDVIVRSGPPINALDMGDGRRAFQFHWGGGAVVVPQTTTATMTTTDGVSVWLSRASITTPAVFVSEGCIITYFARWNEERNGWIVVDYTYPKRLVC
jgi:hypothetical protein